MQFFRVSAQEFRDLFVPHLYAPIRVGKHKKTMTRFIISIISQIVVIITFLGWGLYLWFHVKDFGPQKECNDKVKYVIMFVSIRATNRGLRDFYIFLHIYLSVGLLELLVLRLINMCRLFRPDVEETKEEVTRNDEGSARREEG
jgi:hypothetical protein